MPTQEIPREQWSNFFDSFNRQHEGWLATLEVFATDSGAQQEARDMPFEGISVDSKEGESEALLISVGKTPADHVSHKIDHPVHIWLQKTEAGANAALEIEAEDDSKALLRFRSPMPPEFVDGVILD
jgi:Family of unknown function (DUF5335)